MNKKSLIIFSIIFLLFFTPLANASTYSLNVKVEDKDGVGLSDIGVEIGDEKKRTDSTGFVQFENLEDKNYALRVYSESIEDRSVIVNPSNYGEYVVEVKTKETREEVLVKMLPWLMILLGMFSLFYLSLTSGGSNN